MKNRHLLQEDAKANEAVYMNKTLSKEIMKKSGLRNMSLNTSSGLEKRYIIINDKTLCVYYERRKINFMALLMLVS